MSFVNQEEIFKATNGGLDIILHYYPQADKCVGNNRKFKIRETEKTASCTIKRMPDGNYCITDWGNDSKPKNAIAVVMDEANVDFKTAIQLIADRWNILPEERRVELLKPEIRRRDAQPDEEEGTWNFEVGDYTEKELKTIFSDQVIKYVQDKCEKEVNKGDDWMTRLRKLCKYYHMQKLISYSIVKDRKVTTIASTEHYPIFVFDIATDNGKVIRKIYQPLAKEKENRFRYEPGKRPDDHIFGLNQIRRKYEDLNKEYLAELSEPKKGEESSEKKKEFKFDEIILCSGGSDALNIAALDYQVIWLNSESAKLKGGTYTEIMKFAYKFYIISDIDATGKKTAHELASVYLDLRTIVLPESLKLKTDWRGNPCKDVRDYLKYHKRKDFDNLVKAALPYKFWDEIPQYDKKGQFVGTSYECNNTHLYWFLSQNGFYQYTNKNEVDSYVYVNGNIVSEIDAKKIRKHVNAFLAQRNSDTKLRNTFFRTTQLNSISFENLPHTTIDFTDFDKESQWLFFKNQTWLVKASGITKYKLGEVNKFIWETGVINHRVELLEDFFKITKDADDEYHLEITNSDSIFFKFLQRTCQMHWRVEEFGVDDGKGGRRTELSKDEKREHELHLINKIFTFGYLLHKHKEASSSWSVWSQENEIIEEGQSEGRTGKSLFLNAPQYFIKMETIAARDPKITENKHLFENINEFTDYVLLDDCAEYINFAYFFPYITGPWTINQKHVKTLTLSRNDSPKMAFSSNFSPKHADGSTLDRLIFIVFSDYYHAGGTERNPERRSPRDEFGMDLFDDFSEHEWNLFLNFGAQCLKAYLNIKEKINPPMNQVTQRHLLQLMTEAFKQWADVFFSPTGKNLNTEIVREVAFEDFKTSTSLFKWSSQKFGTAIKAWCKFNGYVFNPKELCNDKNRIIKKVDDKPKEMFFIQAPQAEEIKIENAAKEVEGDSPF